MAEKKLRSKFFEDIQTKYNIVLLMKELTSASDYGGTSITDLWLVKGLSSSFCGMWRYWMVLILFVIEMNEKNKRDEN